LSSLAYRSHLIPTMWKIFALGWLLQISAAHDQSSCNQTRGLGLLQRQSVIVHGVPGSEGSGAVDDTEREGPLELSQEGTSKMSEEEVRKLATESSEDGDKPGKFELRPLRYVQNLWSPFKIQSCQSLQDASGKKLSTKVRKGLAALKKTKCIQVYGLLIAGTQKASSNFMRYFANIAAHLQDPDCDGKVDEQKVSKILNKFENDNAPWLNFGHDQTSEEDASHQTPGMGFSGQVWKASDEPSNGPMIALEEMFHLVHTMAWAKVYPKVLEAKTWVKEFPNDKQSLACLCMREAQCKWYQHPENKGCTSLDGKFCKNPGLAGDKAVEGTFPGTCHEAKDGSSCSYPACDCVEFVHKVYTTWIGNRFNGYSRMGAKLKALQAQGLNQRQAMEKLLSQSAKCSALLVQMKSDALKLPKKHVNETYTCGLSGVPPQPAPGSSPQPAPGSSPTQPAPGPSPPTQPAPGPSPHPGGHGPPDDHGPDDHGPPGDHGPDDHGPPGDHGDHGDPGYH